MRFFFKTSRLTQGPQPSAGSFPVVKSRPREGSIYRKVNNKRSHTSIPPLHAFTEWTGIVLPSPLPLHSPKYAIHERTKLTIMLGGGGYIRGTNRGHEAGLHVKCRKQPSSSRTQSGTLKASLIVSIAALRCAS